MRPRLRLCQLLQLLLLGIRRLRLACTAGALACVVAVFSTVIFKMQVRGAHRVTAICPVVAAITVEIRCVAFEADWIGLEEPAEIGRHETVAIVVETDLGHETLTGERDRGRCSWKLEVGSWKRSSKSVYRRDCTCSIREARRLSWQCAKCYLARPGNSKCCSPASSPIHDNLPRIFRPAHYR